MSFESSSLQWSMPIVAIVLSLVFALDHVRRRRALERIGDRRMIELMTNSLSAKRRIVRALLFTVAMVLCAATLARPTAAGEARWRQRGIDIAFVFDFSASMLAQDVYPNRLERSLKEAELVMNELKADRVASVVFAGGAVHFPLTHDHEAARLLYRGLRPAHLAPGSDLGQALRVASCVLRGEAADPTLCEILGADRTSPLSAELPQISERARAIVLFSDGEDSEGFAEREVDLARSLGIELHVVGVGTKAGELVPTFDDQGHELGWLKDDQGGFVATRLDVDRLGQLVSRAGGRYFSLGEGRWHKEELLESLRDLKRGDLDARVIASRNHIFERFLFPAFLLLIIEACLSERRRRTRLPRQGGAA